jgi:DNA-binding transcriptional LysR family regulator
MIPGALRIFYETVRLGSIRKAGLELGLASSSVSRQIALLERQIGTQLFTRTARGMEVNHAGELVAEFARTVVLDYDALKEDIDDYHGGRRAHLRIATVESLVGAGPSAAIAEFGRTFPRVTYELFRMPSPQVVEAVLAADVDMGLTYAPEPNAKLRTLARISEPLLLLMPDTDGNGGGAAEQRSEVTLDALAGLRLALPSADFGMRRLIDQAAGHAGLAFETILESDSFETLRTFVADGGGATVLPSRALAGKDNSRISAFEIADERLETKTIDLVVLGKRRLSRVMRLFVETLRKQLEP